MKYLILIFLTAIIVLANLIDTTGTILPIVVNILLVGAVVLGLYLLIKNAVKDALREYDAEKAAKETGDGQE